MLGLKRKARFDSKEETQFQVFWSTVEHMAKKREPHQSKYTGICIGKLTQSQNPRE